MGQVHYLHHSRSTRIYNWAYNYVQMYQSEGWFAAGKYFEEVIPEALHVQVSKLIRREFLRRGIDVTF